MRHINRVAIIALTGLLLAGCGKDTAAGGVFPAGYYAEQSESEASKATFTSDNSMSAAGPINTAAMAVSSSAESQDNYEENSGEKIIRSGSVNIQTVKYEKSKNQLQALWQEYQCQINGESESNDDWNWYEPVNDSGTVSGNENRTYRVDLGVPAEKLDAFIAKLDSIDGHVMTKNITANNVTRTYSQNEDKITALEEEQEALLALMSKTDNVSDLVTIQQELANVRAQLMDLNNSNDQIDHEVQYSTLTVSLDEVAVYDDTEEMTLGEKVLNAFKSSGQGFVDFLVKALLFIIYAIPYIAAVIVLLLIVKKVRTTLKIRKAVIRAAEDKNEAMTEIPDSDDEQQT